MEKIKTLTVNGEAYQLWDGEAAHIDDSKISPDAWSSQNTVEKLCPGFTESGTAVTCQPVAGYPLVVVSHITPVEEGSGHSTVKLYRGGKNYFDVSKVSNLAGSVTNNQDGTLTVHESGYGGVGKNTLRSLAPGLQVGKTYILTANSTGSKKYIYLVGYNNSWMYGNSLKMTDVILDSTVLFYMDTNTTGTIRDIQIEPGTTATAFEPYCGEKFTVAFGQEVYGGSFDWRSGILTDADGNKTQLTPQEILALPGVNQLHSDTGDTTVTGKADPTAVIEKLTNAIVALGGNI